MPGNSKRKQIAHKMRTGMKVSSDDMKKNAKSNPFEVIKNKKTHVEVLGRNVKGNNRNVAASAEKAHTQREKSISEDYIKSTKKNIFKDRRFGSAENLQGMTEEEKMYKKLEIQRKKQLKKQKFALADDVTEEDSLTHGGKSIDIAAEFKRLHDDMDEDELDAIDPEMLMRTSLQQDVSGDDHKKPRTQKEIMMEIIEKSKAYREQRKREAEEMSTEIESVDAMMSDLHGLLSFSKDDRSKRVALEQNERDIEFDKLTAQMVQEVKGKATDRQKSAEEIDREEREKLESLEKEREARMNGIMVPVGRDTGDLQDEDVKKKKSYVDEVLDAMEADADAEMAEDAERDEDFELLYGQTRSDAMEEEEEEEKKEEEKKKVTVKSEKKKISRKDVVETVLKEKAERAAVIEQAKNEIPYIIDLPRGVSELCELLNQYVDVNDSIHLVLSRIIKTNNPNVKKERNGEFINFYRNVISLIDTYSTQDCLSSYVMECIQGCLMAMHPYIASNSIKIWSDIISRIRKHIMETTSYPSIADVITLHIAINIFSSTDFRHNIVNPAVLLLAKVMKSCKIRTVSDIAISLYIMGILVDYSNESSRFVPEMYVTLENCSRFLLLDDMSSFGGDKNMNIIFKKGLGKIDITLLCPSKSNTISKTQIQYNLLILIEAVINLNKHNPAAFVYLKPICQILNMCDSVKLDSMIISKMKSIRFILVGVLNETINHRDHIPLQADVLKPVFISYAPHYDDHFTPGKMLHPNKEHVQDLELKNKVKREKRGVERELRREAEVIRHMRDQDAKDIDEQQTGKLKQVMTWLEEDQASYKQAVRKGELTGGGSQIRNNLK